MATEADFSVDLQDIRLEFPADRGSHVAIIRAPDISSGVGSFTQGRCDPEQSGRFEGGRQIFGNISSHVYHQIGEDRHNVGSATIMIPEDCHTIGNLDLMNAASFDFPEGLTSGRFNVQGTSHDVVVQKPLKSKILKWTTKGGRLDFEHGVVCSRASLNSGTGALSCNGLKSNRARLITTGGGLTVTGDVCVRTDAYMSSAYGALAVGNIQGGSLVFDTSGGPVAIGDVDAQHFEVSSGFASSDVGQIGSKTAKLTTSGGALDVAGLFVDSAQTSTAFGATTIGPSSVSSAKIETTGGPVHCEALNDIHTLEIASAFGKVNANMDFPESGSIKTTGGAINARFFGDSGGTLAINSAFGAVDAVFESKDPVHPPSEAFGGRLDITAGFGKVRIAGEDHGNKFKGTVGDHVSKVTIGTTGGNVDLKWHDTSSRKTACRQAASQPTAPPLTQSEMWDESDTEDAKVCTPETSDDEGEPDIPLPDQAPTIEGPLSIEPDVPLPYQRSTVESDDE